MILGMQVLRVWGTAWGFWGRIWMFSEMQLLRVWMKHLHFEILLFLQAAWEKMMLPFWNLLQLLRRALNEMMSSF